MDHWFIACGKSKLTESAEAVHLYTGQLFRRRLEFALARSGKPPRILSAKHGVLDPEQIVEPYDQTLAKKRKAERERWSFDVAGRLLRTTVAGDRLFVLAGALYVDGWSAALRASGRQVDHLFRGLPMGKQLQAIALAGLGD